MVNLTKLQARYWQCTVAPANVLGKGANSGGLTTTGTPATGMKLSGYWTDPNDFAGLIYNCRDTLDHLSYRYPDATDLSNCTLDVDLSAWSGVRAIDDPLDASDFAVRAYDDDGVSKKFYLSTVNYATGNNGAQAKGTVTIGGGTIKIGDIVFAYVGGWYAQYVVLAGDTLQSIGAGLALAMRQNTGITAQATVVNAGAIITVTAKLFGTGGNGITLSAGSIDVAPGNETATASGATLAGGAEPTSWHVHLDFNNLTDSTGRPIPVKRVDSLLWSFVPVTAGFAPGAFSVTLANWTPGGNVALGAEPAALANSGLGVSVNYDAVWNLTPERALYNLQKLGYNGRIDLFIGSEKYYRKATLGSVNYPAGRLYQVDSTVNFNDAANAWFADFLARAQALGYSVMAEIGMECIDPRTGWIGVSNNGVAAGSQANQFIFVLNPSNASLRTYTSNICVAMVNLMATAGLVPRIQFAEWQWWTQNDPYFYDADTKAAFVTANPGKTLFVFTNISQNPNVDPGYGLAWSSTNFLAGQYGSLAAACITAVKAAQAGAKIEVDTYNPSIDPYPLMQQATYDTNNYNHTKVDTFKTSSYGRTLSGDLAGQLADIKFPQTYTGAQAGNNTALGFTAAQSAHVCGYAVNQIDWLAIQAEIAVAQAQSIGVVQIWDSRLINSMSWLNTVPLRNLRIPAGIQNTVTDIQGTSSIGTLQVDLIDPEGTLRSLAGARSLETRTGKLYLGFPGLNSTEFVPIHSFQIRSVAMTKEGVWSLNCDDLQRYAKQTIFTEGLADTNIRQSGYSLTPGGTVIAKGNALPISKTNPFVIRENPITILLVIFQNWLGLGQLPDFSPSDWRLYDPNNEAATLINPNPWVDVPGLLALRNTVFSGELMDFTLTAPTVAKDFIENELFKPNSMFPVVNGAGLLSARLYRAPASGPVVPGYAFTDKNTMGLPQIDRADPLNKVTVSYDYDGSKYLTVRTFYEPGSISLFDQEYVFAVQSQGLKSAWGGSRKSTTLARRVLRRYGYGTPEYTIDSFLQGAVVEAGDYVTYTHPVARDPVTGNIGMSNVLCEVLEKQPSYTDGKITFKLLDTRQMKLGKFIKIAPAARGLPPYPVAAPADQAAYMFVSSGVLGGVYSNGAAGNGIY
jgi:hypothetical protein